MPQALGFSSNARRRDRTAPVTQTAANPRFEGLARLAAGSVPRAEDVIGILLDAALPTRHRGCEALRPLWAEEVSASGHSPRPSG